MMITDPRMTCTPCIYIIPKRSEKSPMRINSASREKILPMSDISCFSFSLSIGAPLRSQVEVEVEVKVKKIRTC